MKKLMMKFGNVVAMFALMLATVSVNATCAHYIYQEEAPVSAKKLSKIK